jgi:hypothetical protein
VEIRFAWLFLSVFIAFTGFFNYVIDHASPLGFQVCFISGYLQKLRDMRQRKELEVVPPLKPKLSQHRQVPDLWNRLNILQQIGAQQTSINVFSFLSNNILTGTFAANLISCFRLCRWNSWLSSAFRGA